MENSKIFLSAPSASLSPPPCQSLPSPKLKIAILTSGGDSQGMNAAIRAVVRMAIAQGCQPYAVHEGYEGLVQGGHMIGPFTWNDVAQIMPLGGTIIGSARSATFRTKQGRIVATKNLITLGIHSLVVIGGDGSLTGAHLLQSEWPRFLEELLQKKEITSEDVHSHPTLSIAGIVGSIDNDMLGTEMTIGADSALHRIIEAIDSITTSAFSHQRVFIIEVMGRHCGWLGLMAAVASGADWLLVPEVPSPVNSWQQEMCMAIHRNRMLGKRASLVILSEGAIDSDGCAVTTKVVQDAIFQHLGIDARSTVLGHVQRGGVPSAFDRIMATLQGVHAVQTLIDDEQKRKSAISNCDKCPKCLGNAPFFCSSACSVDGCATIIGMQESQICKLPLSPCVSLTRSIDDAMKRGALDEAFQLRDADFKAYYDIAQMMAIAHPKQNINMKKNGMAGNFMDNVINISGDAIISVGRDTIGNETRGVSGMGICLAIINVGPPCGGMNTAVYAFTRTTIKLGCHPVGLMGGWDGLFRKDGEELPGAVRPLTWMEVDGWVGQGGSHLGTSRALPAERIDAIKALFRRHHIRGLVIVGGFEAWMSMRQLSQHLGDDVFPIVCIPATISNNVPGSDISLGSDTALNMIVNAVDVIKQSASSSRRVFVVEVQGGKCGYLALFGGLASAAAFSYLPEEGIRLGDIIRDATHLKHRFLDDKSQGRILLLNDSTSTVLTPEVLAGLLEQEGDGLFDVRVSKLGHLQQGRESSPYDRILATRFATMAVQKILDVLSGCEENLPCGPCWMIGNRSGRVVFSTIDSLLDVSDDKYRRVVNPSWMKVRPIALLLAKYTVDPFVLKESLAINEGHLPQIQ